MQRQLLGVLHPDVTVSPLDVVVHVGWSREDGGVHLRLAHFEDALLAELGSRFRQHSFNLHSRRPVCKYVPEEL